MKRFIYKLIGISLLSILMYSCDSTTESEFENKLVMYVYGKAGKSIDSLYLTRYAGLSEEVSFENLAISDADITLKENGELIGTLKEYEDSKGIYYLDKAGFIFTPGNTYTLEGEKSGFNKILSTTICPPNLENISVTNIQTGINILSTDESETAIDTVYYERGESPYDNIMIKCEFDSELIESEDRLASFRIIPDHKEYDYFLEDPDLMEDYDNSVELFKSEDYYGTDYVSYQVKDIELGWDEFYHRGGHTLVFGSTDKAQKKYLATQNNESEGAQKWTNVEGGDGLFTLSNNTGTNTRYRIYVKSRENQMP